MGNGFAHRVSLFSSGSALRSPILEWLSIKGSYFSSRSVLEGLYFRSVVFQGNFTLAVETWKTNILTTWFCPSRNPRPPYCCSSIPVQTAREKKGNSLINSEDALSLQVSIIYHFHRSKQPINTSQEVLPPFIERPLILHPIPILLHAPNLLTVVIRHRIRR